MQCDVALQDSLFCRMRPVLSIEYPLILVQHQFAESQQASRMRDCRYNTKLRRIPPARMKLHHTATQQYQTVTAYDETGVEINLQHVSHSLVVLPEIAPSAWPVDAFEALTAEHFQQISALKPDVIILGTGLRQRFVHPRLTAELTALRIGVECMDNQAACRTYNILMAEGRKVALALIFAKADADA